MDELFVHEVLTRAGHRWKMDGKLVEPSAEDVEELLHKLVEEISGTDYDSIESGGILLKRDGNKIDLYAHLGELNEDSST